MIGNFTFTETLWNVNKGFQSHKITFIILIIKLAREISMIGSNKSKIYLIKSIM